MKNKLETDARRIADHILNNKGLQANIELERVSAERGWSVLSAAVLLRRVRQIVRATELCGTVVVTPTWDLEP